MKNYIFVIVLSLASTAVFSQTKKIKSSKAEPHEKTSYNETGLLKSKKQKKKKKTKSKSSDKTDYSTKEKKETKKRKAIEAEPHVDASNNRKKTSRKATKKF